MIWVDGDLGQQVGGDDRAFLVGRLLRYLGDIEIGKPAGYVLDGPGGLGTGLQALGCFGEFGFECSQLHGEVGFLICEPVGAVSADPTAGPHREIYDIGVLMTMVGGRVEVCIDPEACPSA